MEISEANLIIIEGVPGSGKTTLHNKIVETLKNKTICSFNEGELLFSWKHAWLSEIDEMRLKLMTNVLDYYEKITKQDKNAVFLLDRFHISFGLLNKNVKKTEYDKLLKRLRKYSVQIYFPLIRDGEIEERSSHKERKDPLWDMHLKKRMKERGFSNLEGMYSEMQNKVKELLSQQNLSYSLVKVSIDGTVTNITNKKQ